MRKIILMFSTVLLLCILGACGNSELTVVKDGVSTYTIIYGKDADIEVKCAANELKEYIKDMTGCELEVADDSTSPSEKEILIGKTNREGETLAVDFSGLGDEGFTYFVSGKRLVIAGGEKRGTLYGVYAFLEEVCGCHFYAVELKVIPELKTLSVPSDLSVTQTPAFEYRDSYWATSANSEWAVFNKVNSCTNRDIPDYYGGGIVYATFVHTFSSLVPVDRYFETNPEYFSLINGVRVSDKQLCLTNPEVLEISIAKVKEWLKANPKANIVSVSQNDTNGYCTCSKCAEVDAEEGSHAGTILRFVNAVADAIKDEYPDVAIDTLAYQYSRSAPSVTVPRDNVIIRLCTIECCFSHPIGECDYERGGSDMEETKTPIDDDFADWAKICDRLYVWDYTTNFRFYMTTFPNFNVLQPNLKFFKANNVAGVFEQGGYESPKSGEFGELRAYILAKLLWNPDIDVDAEIKAFMQAYYGEGWEGVYSYLMLCEEKSEENHFHIYSTPKAMFKLSETERAEATAMWDDAEAKAAEDRASLARIKRSRLQFEFYMLANEYVRDYGSRDELAAIRENFYNRIVANGITCIRESRSIYDKPAFTKSPLNWYN